MEARVSSGKPRGIYRNIEGGGSSREDGNLNIQRRPPEVLQSSAHSKLTKLIVSKQKKKGFSKMFYFKILEII
jgi:hypothetical protein